MPSGIRTNRHLQMVDIDQNGTGSMEQRKWCKVGELAIVASNNPGTTVAASSGKWTAYSGHGDAVVIWHYGTRMADIWIRDGIAIDYDLYIGHGSVSDQGGMNQILASVAIPVRYRRDQRGGGPRYVRNEQTTDNGQTAGRV